MDVWSHNVGQIKKRDIWSDSDSGRNIEKVQERRLKWYAPVMRGEEGHMDRIVMAMDVPEKKRKTEAEVDGQPYARLR